MRKRDRLIKEKEVVAKQAVKADASPEDVADLIAIDGNESDAECPKCGRLHSAYEERVVTCPSRQKCREKSMVIL